MIAITTKSSINVNPRAMAPLIDRHEVPLRQVRVNAAPNHADDDDFRTERPRQAVANKEPLRMDDSELPLEAIRCARSAQRFVRQRTLQGVEPADGGVGHKV